MSDDLQAQMMQTVIDGEVEDVEALTHEGPDAHAEDVVEAAATEKTIRGEASGLKGPKQEAAGRTLRAVEHRNRR